MERAGRWRRHLGARHRKNEREGERERDVAERSPNSSLCQQQSQVQWVIVNGDHNSGPLRRPIEEDEVRVQGHSKTLQCLSSSYSKALISTHYTAQ